MKLHWFHLAPWQNLPSDFTERYRSVWVDVPSELYDPVDGHRHYNEYLDELEFADQMGFDGICVNEHHQNAYGLMPSPNLMAAALTRRTSNAAIVVLGNSIVSYNPPVRIAEEFAMLDCMSGGRLVAGSRSARRWTPASGTAGTGHAPREVRRGATSLIMRAWQESEPFAFNGKFTQLRYVNLWPRTLQKPHPPVWVPGGGSIETWEWVAKRNHVYCYLSYSGYKRGKALLDGYWETIDRLGIEPNPYRAGFLQLVAVSETDAQAEADYAEHAKYFYDNCLHIYEGFADPPGYRTLPTLKKGLVGQHGKAVTAARKALTWKELVEQGYVVAGSPASVRQQLQDVIGTLRVGHLMVLQQFGNMPKHKVLKNTELFAREVLPSLRGIWSEWEDHWYPTGIAAEKRVPPAPLPSTDSQANGAANDAHGTPTGSRGAANGAGNGVPTAAAEGASSASEAGR
jgi:alkanesulfonate monooxygenase SsuD/methylene tetrahydromethanopterin reductase-like flavin-dependent oxidoreductase (luciferase family)